MQVRRYVDVHLMNIHSTEILANFYQYDNSERQPAWLGTAQPGEHTRNCNCAMLRMLPFIAAALFFLSSATGMWLLTFHQRSCCFVFPLLRYYIM
jgi:hypothetical protein